MNALTTPNKTLFLSYSRRQHSWCDELYTAIDTYTHYYRWRDNKIPESADWWDSICVNIEGCYAFVAIMSQDYLDSVYCMGELEYAIKLNKPVIALILQVVDYPKQLNDQRLQFARVDGLTMPEVINKVLNACNQITLAYVQDEFSADIHPRKHLRPNVPTPKVSRATPEEDAILASQVDEITISGQIPTRDLMRRYNEEKERDIQLARDLFNKIAKRQDVPVFFDIDEEKKELQLAEQYFAEIERKLQRMKQISNEYEDLIQYVSSVRPLTAIKAVKRFMDAYPDYGDPYGLMQKFKPTTLSLMPVPFEWIKIPNGYSLAKYPVTNAQFRLFINADGYKNKSWWTDVGWKYREKEDWNEPRYWLEDKWNSSDQPVVGISWFEAIAFCQWLSNTTGEKIMLPTEDQWQFAAQGDEALIYPWGNDWDGQRCNNSVKPCNSNGTLPVTQYEGRGDSPFANVDMVGNVWEWCLTDFEKKSNDINVVANNYALRGGSWFNFNTTFFTSLSRIGCNPNYRNSNMGFRIAHS